MKLSVTRVAGEFTVDDLSAPGLPPVGRGKNLREAIGDWLVNNQSKLGVSFELDEASQTHVTRVNAARLNSQR